MPRWRSWPLISPFLSLHEEATAYAWRSGKKILIVDDVVANIKALIAILSDEYQIFFATNGPKALELAASKSFDLILLDIVMPEMNGHAVCRRLRADPATADCPIIFITGIDNPQSEQQGLELGAVDYIAKPFSPAVVRARVVNHLTLQRTLRQLKQQNQALQEADALRKQVEHITRHDMKSPLNGIVGFANLLLQADDIPEPHKPALSIIRQEAYRALHMINLSLGLLRMEQGTYLLAPRPVDLVAILRDIQADLSQMIRAKGLVVVVRLGERLHQEKERFLVWGEELLCYSVLANLLKNSLEASPKGAEVVVSLREEETMQAVEIGNQGGIPLPIRERLFEKYATWGKRTGTGLGGVFRQIDERSPGRHAYPGTGGRGENHPLRPLAQGAGTHTGGGVTLKVAVGFFLLPSLLYSSHDRRRSCCNTPKNFRECSTNWR
ncbi:MAG: hybrid sensor histidine kinase/response regulator [Magnetococcus sp. YQC-3]